MVATSHVSLQAHDPLDSSNDWIFDSGATDHYCKEIAWFTNLEPFTGKVRAANGSDMAIEGRGTIDMEKNTPSGPVQIRLSDVMYIPSIQFNLFSLSRVLKHGFDTKFSEHGCFITRDNKVYAQTIDRHGLFFLDVATRIETPAAKTTTAASSEFSLLTSSPADLWHARLGHISVKYTTKTMKYTNGIDIENGKHDFCPSCLAGKQSKLPFPQRSLTVTTEPFELVHSDICGPMPHPALCSRAKYFITFTDDYSRFGFVFFLLHKSDAFICFKKFMAHCNTQFNKQIRCLRSGNGGEYMSSDFSSYLDEQGIRHERTVPHTPQQNGVSERMNRTLVECARAMLHFANAPLRFWSEAVLHAMYLRNRSYSASTPNGTPYERLYKARPDLSTIRIFGCEAFTHVEQTERSKFASKSLRTMYIGHEPDVKGYRLYCANPEKIIVSRNVIFNETNCFFIDKPINNVSELNEAPTDATPPVPDDTAPAPPVPESPEQAPSLRRSTRARRTPDRYTDSVRDNGNINTAPTSPQSVEAPRVDNTQQSSLPESLPQSPPSSPRQDVRQPTEDPPTVPPAPTPSPTTSTNHPQHEYIPVYDEPTTSVLSPDDDSQDDSILHYKFPPEIPQPSPSPDTNQSTVTRRRHRSFDVYDDINDTITAKRQRILMAFALNCAGLPTSIRQAYVSDERDGWIQATEAEYKSLMEHNTWTLCELPPDRKPIGCRWLFTKKYGADGSLSRYKARLVAQEFTQIAGIDYTDVFAPVIRSTSIRLLLALTVIQQMEIHHMDVETAFLNGNLTETLYMKQPPGFIEPGKEHLVCRLNRSIYGLKQSSREWNIALDSYFRDHSFIPLLCDPCIYVLHTSQGSALVGVYVDDFIILCKSHELLSGIKSDLSSHFKMKDLGQLKLCLGMEILRSDASTILLHQHKYVKDILERHGHSNCHPTSTPQDSNNTHRSSSSPATLPYRTVVDELLCLTSTTRPDIAFTVTMLSRQLSKPSEEHYDIAKRVLRYLKGTQDDGILYQATSTDQLTFELYVDADYANDKGTRRSTSGYLLYLNRCLISWKSKLQNIVALSTSEAEYISMSYGLQEALWIKTLLLELKLNFKLPIIVYEDNQSTIKMAENPTLHQRSKHIDIRHHFIRDLVKSKTIDIKYCETDLMLADILTKALPKPKFETHKNNLLKCISKFHVQE